LSDLAGKPENREVGHHLEAGEPCRPCVARNSRGDPKRDGLHRLLRPKG
jgi:hypothetical protein